MADEIDYGYLLGYAGYGKLESNSEGIYEKEDYLNISPITGVPISLLNGSVVRNLQIPTANSYYLNLDENLDFSKQNEDDNTSTETPGDEEEYKPKDVASKIRMGFGTYSFSGNITFELTRGALSNIFTNGFFLRKYLFNLYMSDGSQSLSIKNNVWNSVTFNYSPQQIPTCSIGFYSNNGGLDDLNIKAETPRNDSMDDELIPYWEAGMNGAEIESFNVTFTRNVSNIYLNNDLKVPTYMRAGIIEMSLNITCFDTSLDDGLCIYFDKDTYLKIPNSTLDEVIQNKTYNISGLNAAGMRNFVITGIRNKPTENIFVFSKNKDNNTR